MRYLIIGNGVAGTSAASNIRKLDDKGEITILTDETMPFYSRIRLIEYLAETVKAEDLVIYKQDWYEKNKIKLLPGIRVTDIDKKGKTLTTSKDEKYKYDRLLLATGGYSFVPPITGSDKKGVFTLRTLKDADNIVSYIKGTKKVLLIGGGILGLEAGNSLRKTGHDVIVAEFFPRLLPKQVDPEGSEILKTKFDNMGFTFYLGASSKEILGNDKATGLLLEDGTKIDCDSIIISTGIRPRAKLAKKLGLKINKGLPVNDSMQTEISDIYAAGDLIEHRGIFYGIWPASQKQGEIAGKNMAGGDDKYTGTTLSNVLKVAGVDLAAAGDIDAEGKYESIIKSDRGKYLYKKLVIKDNVLSGCILFGDITEYRKILKAIGENRDVKTIRDSLEKWDLSGI